jgi:hypothetical protein
MWVGLLTGMLLNALSAVAEELPSNAKGWYGGLGISQNMNELTEDYLNSRSWVLANPSETSVDNQSTGFSVYMGWRFMKYLALDVGYINLGETSYHLGARSAQTGPRPPGGCAFGCPAAIIYPPSDYSLDTTIFRAAVKGSFPIGERWSLDGHLGLGTESWKVSNGAEDRGSSDDLVAMIGLGGSYLINDHWCIRLDWDRYMPINDIGASAGGSSAYGEIPNASHGAIYDSLNVNSLSLNIEYRL